MGQLEGKVAVITGSSKGIGAAIAERFGQEGASIVVNSRSSVEEGELVAASLPSAVYQQADVTVDGAADELVDRALSEFGRLDIVVNNAAGIQVPWTDDLRDQTVEVWQWTLANNLIAPYQLVAAAAPALRANGDGSVLNISSVIALRPFGPSIPYAVSKAALVYLTKILAVELGPEIRVNAIAPGFIDTPWTADLSNENRAAIRQQVIDHAPLRRTGRPEDIAAAAMALTLSSYTTGETLAADGGQNLTR